MGTHFKARFHTALEVRRGICICANASTGVKYLSINADTVSAFHRSGHARLHHSLAIAGAHAPHPIMFALCGRFRTPTRSAQQRRAHRSERTKTMTVVAPRWPTRLQPNNFVLATDLDGALLANTPPSSTP